MDCVGRSPAITLDEVLAALSRLAPDDIENLARGFFYLWVERTPQDKIVEIDWRKTALCGNSELNSVIDNLDIHAGRVWTTSVVMHRYYANDIDREALSRWIVEKRDEWLQKYHEGKKYVAFRPNLDPGSPDPFREVVYEDEPRKIRRQSSSSEEMFKTHMFRLDVWQRQYAPYEPHAETPESVLE